MTAKRIPVEKLTLKGCSTGTYFEFPQVTSSAKDELFVKEEFAHRVLTKMGACVGVGIYSLKLNYSDGTESPLLGSREPNHEMNLSSNGETQDHVAVIKMQAWEGNYVQGV